MLTDSRSEGALRRAANIAFALLQMMVPALPYLGMGVEIGARSSQVHTLITPAGWAFSIWGPLYLGSLAYAIYQALPSQRGNARLARIGWYSAGAFLGNALWALYVQYRDLTVISVVIIAFTLICALLCFRAFARHRGGFRTSDHIFVVVPLSALAAWLTAATIVNIAAALQYHGLHLAHPEIATAVVIVVGGVIAALALANSGGNPWFALVFLWALAGIYSAGGQGSAKIAAGVILAAALVIGATLYRLSQRDSRRHWLSASGSAVG